MAGGAQERREEGWRRVGWRGGGAARREEGWRHLGRRGDDTWVEATVLGRRGGGGWRRVGIRGVVGGGAPGDWGVLCGEGLEEWGPGIGAAMLERRGAARGDQRDDVWRRKRIGGVVSRTRLVWELTGGRAREEEH
jgi:hypothetical protein